MTTHYQCSMWWLAHATEIHLSVEVAPSLQSYYSSIRFRCLRTLSCDLCCLEFFLPILAQLLGLWVLQMPLTIFSVAPVFCHEFLTKTLIFDKKKNKQKVSLWLHLTTQPKFFMKKMKLGQYKGTCTELFHVKSTVMQLPGESI